MLHVELHIVNVSVFVVDILEISVQLSSALIYCELVFTTEILILRTSSLREIHASIFGLDIL